MQFSDTQKLALAAVAQLNNGAGMQSLHAIEEVVLRNCQAGFAAGSIICEITFSQIIFMILNFRLFTS